MIFIKLYKQNMNKIINIFKIRCYGNNAFEPRIKVYKMTVINLIRNVKKLREDKHIMEVPK